VTPNTVDHAIAEIRHALNDHQEPTRFIRTIPREGYCFIAEVTEKLRQPSLAILPFAALGLEGSKERVGVGLADALITHICNLNQMTVCSTAAVLKYAGGASSPVEAGRELGADFVLEGLIQKSDGLVRITLQLIQVSDGKSVWAETFDEKFTSLFSLEDAFVEWVTRVLPSPFGVREARKADASGT
jgi:TolB-like protein